MSSIITNQFRLENLKAFQAAVADTVNNSFYMCLAKPLEWDDEVNPDTPVDSDRAMRDLWDNALSGKKVTSTNMRQGIYLRPWVSGQYYDMYRDDYDGTIATKNLDGSARAVNPISLFETNFYVVNPANLNVYKCLYNRSKTTNLPVASTDNAFLTDTTGNIVKTSDDYEWVYMYTVSPADAALFNTPSFIPADTSGSPILVAGAIYEIIVDVAGAYTVAPTVTIVGDGAGATATAHVAGGGVVWIEINAPGSGYTHAKVNFSGGTGGGGTQARAVINPVGGHGSAPADELGGTYLIIQQRFIADESGAFTVDNDFRQIGLIKNPTLSAVLVTSSTIELNRRMVFVADPAPGTPAADAQITGGTSNAKGKVIDYDAASNTLRYNLDFSISTAYLGKNFQVGDVVTDGVNSATIDTGGIVAPDADRYTGSLIYYENRTAIVRSNAQTEDCRLIVEF